MTCPFTRLLVLPVRLVSAVYCSGRQDFEGIPSSCTHHLGFDLNDLTQSIRPVCPFELEFSILLLGNASLSGLLFGLQRSANSISFVGPACGRLAPVCLDLDRQPLWHGMPTSLAGIPSNCCRFPVLVGRRTSPWSLQLPFSVSFTPPDCVRRFC